MRPTLRQALLGVAFLIVYGAVVFAATRAYYQAPQPAASAPTRGLAVRRWAIRSRTAVVAQARVAKTPYPIAGPTSMTRPPFNSALSASNNASIEMPRINMPLKPFMSGSK